MLYITGIHALNLPCHLSTSGDWHQSALQWDNPQIRESNEMFYKDYGIELEHAIPEHTEKYNIANTLRALLDLLYEQNFSLAQGAKEDFIGNSDYDEEFFNQVWKMNSLDYWDKIDSFMNKEYRMKWKKYKDGKMAR